MQQAPGLRASSSAVPGGVHPLRKPLDPVRERLPGLLPRADAPCGVPASRQCSKVARPRALLALKQSMHPVQGAAPEGTSERGEETGRPFEVADGVVQQAPGLRASSSAVPGGVHPLRKPLDPMRERLPGLLPRADAPWEVPRQSEIHSGPVSEVIPIPAARPSGSYHGTFVSSSALQSDAGGHSG